MQHHTALLPSGFADQLPPRAIAERRMRSHLLETFGSFGYEEVSPPLMEYEENLADRDQAFLSRQTFRVMDPTSQRMMAIRADMTPQISRIAATRLSDRPHPIRLCYAGTCLRVKGEGLYKSRQMLQAGAELIGADGQQAFVEVLRCAQEGLSRLGIDDLSIDLTLPGLVNVFMQEIEEDKRSTVEQALLQKDRHTIETLSIPYAETLISFMDGVSRDNLQYHLTALPSPALQMLEQWLDTTQSVTTHFPHIQFSFDPLEEYGFGYYDGIGFSLFSSKIGYEIGRGGRYIAHDNLIGHGFTLYLNPLMKLAESLNEQRTRCLIVHGSDEKIAASLRQQGWQTLYGHKKDDAARLSCHYILTKEMKEPTPL